MSLQDVKLVSPEGKSLDLFYEACDCGSRCANFSGNSRTYKSITEIRVCDSRKTDIKKHHIEGKPFPLTYCSQKSKRPARPMEL